MNFEHQNPVIRGNTPDPSVVRVGGDFYLATSSFEYHPVIVIRRSNDLVSWTILGAAVTRPAQYRRDGKPGAIMLFAPTLGISTKSLQTWKALFSKPVAVRNSEADLVAELRRVKKKLVRVTEERDILKNRPRPLPACVR